jgi:hypothetical protein
MKFFSLQESVQQQNTSVINVKTIQIKKISSLQDMIALKNKFGTLKVAVKIGEKLFV